jgi:hypothetical protein
MVKVKSYKTREQKGLSNHEIVTLAVYLLGGDTQHVDTEDIAVKANEIAPRRFTWRLHSRAGHLTFAFGQGESLR